MPDFIFRKASIEDLPHIVAMLADDALGTSREIASDPIAEEYAVAFEMIDADPNQFLAVLTEVDGRMVGTLQITFLHHLTHRGMKRAQIEGVRVASGTQGQGIGTELFRHAIAEARARGCSVVQLTTDRQRPEAHAFYEKLGFKPTHTGFKLRMNS
ncbi:GNAT family N-acetyltransferase [Falsirhodobacter xinxiangensis]|uniref:GNAT family N-acetyltransferase n=1 Tax=Falsirhodobacter xinxiangensis TaxID=2530049 RepID=UPI0010A9F95D|nr:GNAT family N-acetyltransferase [Rhodobacter xinxiangensis]